MHRHRSRFFVFMHGKIWTVQFYGTVGDPLAAPFRTGQHTASPQLRGMGRRMNDGGPLNAAENNGETALVSLFLSLLGAAFSLPPPYVKRSMQAPALHIIFAPARRGWDAREHTLAQCNWRKYAGGALLV